jgi:methylated-DNA-[protein]-cysteine S-methyltransferase
MSVKTWDMLSFEYGTVALVVEDDRLCRVCFTCSPQDAVQAVEKFCPDARRSSSRLAKEVFDQLQEYFRGERKTLDVRLDDTALSDFARNVHKALQQVPYGSVVAYRDLARLAGSPGAARAVGRVMSANPFPLIVPCHRVVNADGQPGHYSGGFGKTTKVRLIDFEHRVTSQS